MPNPLANKGATSTPPFASVAAVGGRGVVRMDRRESWAGVVGGGGRGWIKLIGQISSVRA